MRCIRTYATLVGGLVLATGSMPLMAADLIVDTFDSSSVALADTTADGSPVSVTQTGLPEVLSGRRITSLQLRQPGSLTASLTNTAADDAMMFAFQQSSSIPAGGSASAAGLEYGSGDLNNQMNADLTAGGNDRFRLTFTAAPVGGTVMIQTTTYGGGGFATSMFVIPGPGTYERPFNTFDTSGSSYNFANVDIINIALLFDPNRLADTYSISDFRVTSAVAAVPEPGTTGSILAVVAGAMLSRRRVASHVN